jgi:hypothetical protein
MVDGLGDLETRVDPNGLWSEFDTPAGASNEWVTGFVAATIRGTPGAERPVARAVRRLLARPRSGGWGYSEGLPIDCDSTAWVLHALGPRGARPLIVRRALDAVLAHQVDGAGGFATYAARGDVLALIERAGDDGGSVGWLSPQPCVTAVALTALQLHGEPTRSPHMQAGLEYLLAARRDDVWRSYWWPGELYATYHALRACMWSGALGRTALRRTVAAVLERRRGVAWADGEEGHGDVFATALGTLIALFDPASRQARTAATRAAAWLVAHRRGRRGWPPSARLVIPESDLGSTVVRLDERGLFTTATAVRALAAVRRAMGRRLA